MLSIIIYPNELTTLKSCPFRIFVYIQIFDTNACVQNARGENFSCGGCPFKHTGRNFNIEPVLTICPFKRTLLHTFLNYVFDD